MRNKYILLVLVLDLILILIPSTFMQRVSAQNELSLLCGAEYPSSFRVILVCGPGSLWNGMIYVYNRQQRVDPSKRWQENVSQTDALWIFDARPEGQRAFDGRGSLIIDFRPEGSGLRADVYDDQNHDGVVAYSVPAGDSEPLIKENANLFPTIRVRTDENWWQQVDKTNYNLNITIDGPVRGDFASDVSRYYDQFKTDNTPDFTIEVRDNNKDGIADYEYRDSPIKGNYIHSSIMVSNETRQIPISGNLIWPFLATGEWGFDQAYNQMKAPIQVHWQTARIVSVGEFVPSRGRPSNWFVYSIDRVAKGRKNPTNFESPFAFYDLSGKGDGFPDLAVRFERFNPGEFVRDFQEPIQSIRYSWDQYHRQAWDFKVDLLGRHEITGTVQLNDFSIQTVPYEQIPQWTVSKTWDQVNFVAVEGPGLFYSSEGIYEWPTQNDVREFYITGQEDRYSLAPFDQLASGYRAEYRVAPNSKPQLYIDAVDHKLHLFGSQGGLWNIDGRSKIAYADLNGDGYVDQWNYTRAIGEEQVITQTEQLDVSSSFLVYGNDQDVLIRQASVKPSLADAMPPTNHNEWQALGTALKASKSELDPTDLRGMMEQFDGPEMQILGASLHNFRATGKNSFRFVLGLNPGFQVKGESLLDFGNLQPGNYVVTYDGTLRIAPLTPPNISGSLIVPGEPRQLNISAVQVRLRNVGQKDIPEATIELWAAPPQGQSTVVVTQTVSLLAQVPITSTLDWTPRIAGKWTLTPRVRDPDNQQVMLAPVVVTVRSTQNPNLLNLFLLGTAAIVPLTILGLILIAATAAFIFWRRWKDPQGEQTDDTV